MKRETLKPSILNVSHFSIFGLGGALHLETTLYPSLSRLIIRHDQELEIKQTKITQRNLLLPERELVCFVQKKEFVEKLSNVLLFVPHSECILLWTHKVSSLLGT